MNYRHPQSSHLIFMGK